MPTASDRKQPSSKSSIGPSPIVMHAKANRLVLDRWKTRHERSCHFAAHKSLCRVPRTLVHVRESEGTHRFLSYLFEATSAIDLGEDFSGIAASESSIFNTNETTDMARTASPARDRTKSDASNVNSNAAIGYASEYEGSDAFEQESQQQNRPTKRQMPLVLDIPEPLRPQDFVALHAIASTHPTLRAVLLRANALDDLCFKVFHKLLSTNCNITHIGWKGHCADGSGGRDDVATKSPRLNKMGLKGDLKQSALNSDGDEEDDDGNHSHDPFSEEEESEDIESDPRVLATIQRFRKQISLEEQFPEGIDRKSRLRTFQSKRAAGVDVSGGDGHYVASTSQTEPLTGIKPKSTQSPKNQIAIWVKQLRILMQQNIKRVAERKKAEWVSREVRLYKKSVDVFCSYMQTFIVAERSLRADLIVMEDRQRTVLLASITKEKKDALRIDRSLRLIQSIADRLVWIQGREASFRELLCDEYLEDCLTYLFEMEPSRRTSIIATEANSRVILRSIGNSSWAAATRAEKTRKEAQRLAKLGIEDAEDVTRREYWQHFVKELRRLKHDEQEGRYSATAAGVLRADRERRELAQARRAEEIIKDKEAKAARDAALQRNLFDNAQRKDREKLASDEEQWRAKFTGLCDDFWKAIAELAVFEEALFVSVHEEGRSRSVASHYLQLLNATILPVLRAHAMASAAGFTLDSSMSFSFSSIDVNPSLASGNNGGAENPFALSFSSFTSNEAWAQHYQKLTSKVQLPQSSIRVPPAAFAKPIDCVRDYGESALHLLLSSSLY